MTSYSCIPYCRNIRQCAELCKMSHNSPRDNPFLLATTNFKQNTVGHSIRWWKWKFHSNSEWSSATKWKFSTPSLTKVTRLLSNITLFTIMPKTRCWINTILQFGCENRSSPHIHFLQWRISYWTDSITTVWRHIYNFFYTNSRLRHSDNLQITSNLVGA